MQNCMLNWELAPRRGDADQHTEGRITHRYWGGTTGPVGRGLRSTQMRIRMRIWVLRIQGATGPLREQHYVGLAGRSSGGKTFAIRLVLPQVKTPPARAKAAIQPRQGHPIPGQ